MTDPQVRLREDRDEIASTGGLFSADNLGDASKDAADVDRIGGSPSTLEALARDYGSAAAKIEQARYTLSSIRRKLLDNWAGDAANAADNALGAVGRALERGTNAMAEFSRLLRRLSDDLSVATPSDDTGIGELRFVAPKAANMAMAWGLLPDPTTFDYAELYRLRDMALRGADDRIRAHRLVSGTAREVSTELYDLSGQARLGRLAGSPLSSLDELLIADAGSTGQNMDEAVLTAAMAERAAGFMSRFSAEDQARLKQMLDGAASADHKAYLIKAVAAGYSVDEVEKFNKLISPYAGSPTWLREHLSPLDLSGADPVGTQTSTVFDGKEWTQGPHPTCVASSTVTARAQVDPLYALQLTTGGHPGDSTYDNGTAFAQRLRDEQVRVYDGGRNFIQWAGSGILGEDWFAGMSDSQSQTVANQEIGPRTGQEYSYVDLGSDDDRRQVLDNVERAVDQGHPVPVLVRDDSGGHQMIIVGHEKDKLQIYNPWGHTVWVNESDFIEGHMDKVAQGVPKVPDAVAIPRGTSRGGH